MIVEKAEKGDYWIAKGAGYFRRIIVEAPTRPQAITLFMEHFNDQRRTWQLEKKTS